MTLTLELSPSVEAWVATEARRRGVPAAELISRVIVERVTARSTKVTMTSEERIAAMDRLAEEWSNGPHIPDSAFDRETIYEDRL
jgi:hypothetical protein